MKIHRFIGEYDLSKKEIEITNPKNIKQIKDVLRMKKGDIIILSNKKGNSAKVNLDSFSPKKITGIISTRTVSARTVLAESKARKINLYLAILKKENFEMAAQKAVECGVAEIIPVITERTIKTGLNIERLEKIILEASEQSGRSFVPTLSPILKFQNALIAGNNSTEKIIFHLVDNIYIPTPSTSSRPSANKVKDISIFIGPEGGFTEKEINLAKDFGYTVASLGHLTLRAETAAIIATYQTVYGK